MATALERFTQAIDYPEAPPAGASAFTLVVDGDAVEATVAGGRLRLVKTLRGEEGDLSLSALAGYAAGRLLKEEAVLAWDAAREAPILWQDVEATADATQLRRFFEVFATSCDWWAARAHETRQEAPRVPEMMIMP